MRAVERRIDNRRLPHVIRRLEDHYERVRAPVVTFLAATSRDPYRVLAACLLSLRTQDATTAAAAERLFRLAPDVETLARAPIARVRRAIYPVGFYRTKAKNLVRIAKILVADYGGVVPDDLETLLTLPGVGRKTANLVVSEAYGKAGICVDTHVHRITNRWRYVRTKTPEQTEAELRRVLPRRYWKDVNRLLVAFGQTVCKPVRPLCGSCPIEKWCVSARQ